MSSFFHRVKHALLANEALIIVLFLVLIVRVPNLFEPYWYGDEGIYLTIGHAMKNGFVLYKDIIDHKTPLIYVFAMVPSLFWLKTLLLGWSIVMTAQIFSVAHRLFGTTRKAFLVSLLFALLTSLPALEGNIANGELFVLGFVTTALWFFSKSTLFASLDFGQTKIRLEPGVFFATGFSLGMALMTKVPALLDLGFYVATFLVVLIHKRTLSQIKAILTNAGFLCIGLLTPLAISVLYFATQQSLAEYFRYGLLYNFHYSGTFSLPFDSPILRSLFSLPGKTTFLAILFLFVILPKKEQGTTVARLLFFWFACTLFATLLSSRPYPHYWLQTALPMSLLAGIAVFSSGRQKGFFFAALALLLGVLILFQVNRYPTVRYYQRFAEYALGTINREAYIQDFNPIMKETYALAEYIQTTTNTQDRLFVWGTNPMLYALSRRMPAGRFTVSFHIKDFQAYEETMIALQQYQPKIIVVMQSETESFESLKLFLSKEYIEAKRFGEMQTFRRLDTVR